MKIVKRFAVLAVALSLSSGLGWARKPRQTPAPAASRAGVPLVTRDNFVSLTVSTSGGIANLRTDVSVQNSSISYFSGPPFVGGGSGGGRFESGGFDGGNGFGYPGSGFGYRSTPGHFGHLSNNQLDVVLRAISESRLPALAGTYHQKGLADGINEFVTLTISDEQNRDRTFRIENYGDTAPRAYNEFMARLRAFIALKFPEPATPTQPQPAPVQPAPAQ